MTNLIFLNVNKTIHTSYLRFLHLRECFSILLRYTEKKRDYRSGMFFLINFCLHKRSHFLIQWGYILFKHLWSSMFDLLDIIIFKINRIMFVTMKESVSCLNISILKLKILFNLGFLLQIKLYSIHKMFWTIFKYSWD